MGCHPPWWEEWTSDAWGDSRCQSYIWFVCNSMLPWVKVSFGWSLCMSRTMLCPTQHVTRLLFWCNGYMEFMDWPAWGPDMNHIVHISDQMVVWIRDTDVPLPLCHNCGVLPSTCGLKFAQEGWGPWWRVCHIVCMLFLPPDGSDKVLMVLWHGCKHA